MIFRETGLEGAFIVVPDRKEDSRGFFARSWCTDEFEKYALETRLVQCNISYNSRKGTLRGMHYQKFPWAETKLVRCTMGAIYDVIVDIREDSPTYLKWFGIDLTAANRTMLYIPKEFAHGFQTLADETEVFYQMGEYFNADFAHGFRWDDPKVGIEWPIAETIMSDKDRLLPGVPG